MRVFKVLDTVIKLMFITIVVIGTELTIAWNHIGNVNTPGTAGQLIPLLISIGSFLHVGWAVHRGMTTKPQQQISEPANASIVPTTRSHFPLDDFPASPSIQENDTPDVITEPQLPLDTEHQTADVASSEIRRPYYV